MESLGNSRSKDDRGPVDHLPHVAIIGGGLAGTAAAYHLNGSFRVTLFEKREKLGGHIDTVSVDLDGEVIRADMGAQYTSPETHPEYCALLRELGFGFGRIGDGTFFSRPADMTFFRRGSSRPEFIAPLFYSKLWPLFRKWNFKGLAAFSRLRKAARALRRNDDPTDDRTIGQWLDNLHGSSTLMYDLALGLFAAMNGSSLADTRDLSLREGAFFFYMNLHDNPMATIEYYSCTDGLGAVIGRIADTFSTVDVHCGEGVQAVSAHADGGHSIRTTEGAVYADYVILACPPYISTGLLEDNDAASAQLVQLRRFDYFPSRIVLHRDACYMPRDPGHWSLYTTEMTDTHCEASIWYSNGIRSDKQLFKSWATNRPVESKEIVAERIFRHPLINLEFVGAQRALRELQGRNGIYFAGSYTDSVDSQETACISGKRAAAMIRERHRQRTYA